MGRWVMMGRAEVRITRKKKSKVIESETESIMRKPVTVNQLLVFVAALIFSSKLRSFHLT